jgi:hypothetical protein
MMNTKGDFVFHPRHYKFRVNGTDMESWDILDALFRNNAHLWNTGKYLFRVGNGGKNNDLEDLKKARQYLNREIARLEKVDAIVTPLNTTTITGAD